MVLGACSVEASRVLGHLVVSGWFGLQGLRWQGLGFRLWGFRVWVWTVPAGTWDSAWGFGGFRARASIDARFGLGFRVLVLASSYHEILVGIARSVRLS